MNNSNLLDVIGFRIVFFKTLFDAFCIDVIFGHFFPVFLAGFPHVFTKKSFGSVSTGPRAGSAGFEHQQSSPRYLPEKVSFHTWGIS